LRQMPRKGGGGGGGGCLGGGIFGTLRLKTDGQNLSHGKEGGRPIKTCEMERENEKGGGLKNDASARVKKGTGSEARRSQGEVTRFSL